MKAVDFFKALVRKRFSSQEETVRIRRKSSHSPALKAMDEDAMNSERAAGGSPILFLHG